MIELKLKFDDWGEVQSLINNLEFAKMNYEDFVEADRYLFKAELEKLNKVRKQVVTQVLTYKKGPND